MKPSLEQSYNRYLNRYLRRLQEVPKEVEKVFFYPKTKFCECYTLEVALKAAELLRSILSNSWILTIEPQSGPATWAVIGRDSRLEDLVKKYMGVEINGRDSSSS